jgi:hypothetical protein
MFVNYGGIFCTDVDAYKIVVNGKLSMGWMI